MPREENKIIKTIKENQRVQSGIKLFLYIIFIFVILLNTTNSSYEGSSSKKEAPKKDFNYTKREETLIGGDYSVTYQITIDDDVVTYQGKQKDNLIELETNDYLEIPYGLDDLETIFDYLKKGEQELVTNYKDGSVLKEYQVGLNNFIDSSEGYLNIKTLEKKESYEITIEITDLMTYLDQKEYKKYELYYIYLDILKVETDEV